MAKEKAIIRTLGSVESLGNVTNICTDKTGTLTQGKMAVTYLWTASGSGNKVNMDDSASKGGSAIHLDKSSKLAITISSLCNSSSVSQQIVDGKQEWIGVGSPTEVAMAIYGEQMKLSKTDLQLEWTYRSEFPFDSLIKRMSVIYTHNEDSKLFVFTKGAPEQLLANCSMILAQEDKPEMITEKHLQIIAEKNAVMASEGLRVLGLCYRTIDEIDKDRAKIENEFTFVGLIGISDPPRDSVPSSVQTCHNAGITVHMVTGDHLLTAKAIAKQIGIIPKGLSTEQEEALVTTALEFEALTDQELFSLPQLPLVIARCSPER